MPLTINNSDGRPPTITPSHVILIIMSPINGRLLAICSRLSPHYCFPSNIMLSCNIYVIFQIIMWRLLVYTLGKEFISGTNEFYSGKTFLYKITRVLIFKYHFWISPTISLHLENEIWNVGVQHSNIICSRTSYNDGVKRKFPSWIEYNDPIWQDLYFSLLLYPFEVLLNSTYQSKNWPVSPLGVDHIWSDLQSPSPGPLCWSACQTVLYWANCWKHPQNFLSSLLLQCVWTLAVPVLLLSASSLGEWPLEREHCWNVSLLGWFLTETATFVGPESVRLDFF